MHEALREGDILKKQIELERQRYQELERVVASERKMLHERDFNQGTLYRQTED